ncbi:hypothetical protein [Kitasatospora albolonga]|uniref:hypothetical protein n=1 Tax=Kitasatospora albolonga TaxID=68173 RepID=UPI003CD085A6
MIHALSPSPDAPLGGQHDADTHEVTNSARPVRHGRGRRPDRCWPPCPGGAGWPRSSCTPSPAGGHRTGRPSGARLAKRVRACYAPTTATGHRIDEVEFHPAWHELMTVAGGARPLHGARSLARTRCAAGAPHTPRGRPEFYVWGRSRPGTSCRSR